MVVVEPSYASVIVIACIVVVVVAIVVYVRRLGIPIHRSGVSKVGAGDLRRVPTMSYFMTEPGQNQDGIVIDQGGYDDSLQPFLGVS